MEYTQDMTMKEVARSSKAAAKVIEKHFGKDCFKCPSFEVEPLFMGARQHAVDLEVLLTDLNAAK